MARKKSSDGDEEMDLLNRVWFVLIEKLSITSDWWQFILQKHLRWFLNYVRNYLVPNSMSTTAHDNNTVGLHTIINPIS